MTTHDDSAVRMLGAAPDASQGVMIMIHGRNAGPGNILELASALHHPRFSFLAPAARGGSWYPLSFMADTERNEPFLSESLETIDRLVRTVEEKGVPRSRIILLGFSQGGCLAGEYAVRHAGRYGGVMALSAGLIGPPGTVWSYEGRFDGTPVFLGCSDVDPHIPKARVDESAAVFSRMGATVTEKIYPGMGHQVNEDELDVVRDVMQLVAATLPPRTSVPGA